MGAPLYSDAIKDAVAGYVNAGITVPIAARASGISWSTCKNWLRRGRSGEAPYDEFVAAIERAKGLWAAGAIMRINKAGVSDWRADAWLLERREWRSHWLQKPRKHDNPQAEAARELSRELLSTAVDKILASREGVPDGEGAE